MDLSEIRIHANGHTYYVIPGDEDSIESAIVNAYEDGLDDQDDEYWGDDFDKDEYHGRGVVDERERVLDLIDHYEFKIRHGSAIADQPVEGILRELKEEIDE